CVPEPPCDTDSDCRQSEVCRNSSCERPPCRSNDDCPADLACDLAFGDCVGGECEEDVLAPNHSAGAAADLGFETLTGLRLCPGRDDWYALPVESSESIDLRVEHPADRDLDAAVFGTDGQLIAANRQVPDPDRAGDRAFHLRFFSRRRQTVRIRIFAGGPSTDRSERPAGGTLYQLRVSHPAGDPCVDDDSEENDHPATAADLPIRSGTPSRLQFQICGSDTDWFRLPDVAADHGVRATLLDAANHLTLELRSHAGHVAAGRSGQQLIFRRAGTRGDWLLRVASDRSKSGTYDLRWEVTPPFDCPQSGHHAEPGKAVSVSPGSPVSFAFCPSGAEWEIDWLDLESPSSTSTLHLRLTPNGGFPEAEVTLYERVLLDSNNGKNIGYKLLRTASRTDGAYRLSKLVGPSQELLLRIGSEQRLGAFRQPPGYTVEYGYSD
ncbi:MAG: hypothetical protein ABEL76_02890, partial [Bradymonadaceae bacterium]